MQSYKANRYKNIRSKGEYVGYYRESEQAEIYARTDLVGANPLLTKVETALVLAAAEQYLTPKKSKLLDLATGPGRIIQGLEDHFNFSVGIDSSLPMLAYAKQRTKRTLFVASDIEFLPFNNSQFDLITGFKFLINLPKKTRLAIYKEARRVLKDEGILAVNFHLNALSPRGVRDVVFRMRPSSKVITSFAAKKEIEQAGFEIAGIYGVNMIVLYRIFSFISPEFLVHFDRSIGRIFPLNYFSDTFIVFARKSAG